MTNCNKCGRSVGGSSMYCPACYDEMEQFENARLDNAQLRKRISELEAAQQWHPASEPPENLQRVEIKTDGHILRAIYVHSLCGYAVTFCDKRYIISHTAVDGWRDLPPVPEVEE